MFVPKSPFKMRLELVISLARSKERNTAVTQTPCGLPSGEHPHSPPPPLLSKPPPTLLGVPDGSRLKQELPCMSSTRQGKALWLANIQGLIAFKTNGLIGIVSKHIGESHAKQVGQVGSCRKMAPSFPLMSLRTPGTGHRASTSNLASTQLCCETLASSSASSCASQETGLQHNMFLFPESHFKKRLELVEVSQGLKSAIRRSPKRLAGFLQENIRILHRLLCFQSLLQSCLECLTDRGSTKNCHVCHLQARVKSYGWQTYED